VSRTFVILKPDAVERGLVGEILGRFERRQLRLAAAELRTIDEATARRHYGEHEVKAFFDTLVAFITRGPSLLAIIEGPEETWKIVRTMMGATNSLEAASGTIRGDLATHGTENLIHGSDSEESAQREIAIFFSDLV
jgi:nucleoside-diphosphate kinase